MNIKELREKALRIEHEARALLTDNTELASDTEAQFDRMLAEADALSARADRLADLEARDAARAEADLEARRPVEDRQIETAKPASAEDREAALWTGFIRDTLSREERSEFRAQTVTGTGAEGGYLVPQTHYAQIVRSMAAFGPMLNPNLVNLVETLGGGQWNVPTNDDTGNAGALISENTAVSAASLTFGTKTLGAHKFTSNLFTVSDEMLQDSAYDVVSFVNSAIGERLGRALNAAFTTGDGSDKPQGIVGAATSAFTSAANTTVTADEILTLIHSVDPAYRASATMMFNDATALVLRKLKAETSGEYLWQPSIQAGQPGTIFGHNYVINPAMASIGASTKPILFGDFKRFTVRAVKGINVVRLNERYADQGLVGFIGFARYDSELLDSKAVKVITIKA
jgi:HK97 family phage major capsid protein